MRKGLQFLAVAVSVLMLSGFAASLTVPSAPVTTDRPEIRPTVPGSSPKLNVMELFTGAWCPPCANADPAISRIADEYGPNLLLLEYHCCSAAPNYDPYFDPLVYNVRRAYYVPATFGIPTAIFDGGSSTNDPALIDVGASGTISTNYVTYRTELTNYVEKTSNIAMSIEADLNATLVRAKVTITATDPVPETNLNIRAVVYEDSLYYMGTNGQPYHRNTVRALYERPITIPPIGTPLEHSVTFALDPSWNHNKLGVAAFVQSNTTVPVMSGGYQFTIADILNAARYDFVQPGILLHGDKGTLADYLEVYEKVASSTNEHFRTHNTLDILSDTGTVDVKQVPDGRVLDDTSLVIWHTGAESVDSLSDAERAILGSYLDGHGNLVLTGSNIGFWLQSDVTVRRPWLNNYLHATFQSDDTGEFFVNGVASDPISGPFAGTDLGIMTSADRIDAYDASAVVPFRYKNTGWPAGVRAQHDANSRVLYMPFQYFENTIDANRGAVLTSIINWMDGASPPEVSLDAPYGCEVLEPGTTYDIRWKARDVRIPANGVDLFYTTTWPVASWQSIASGEPNDGRYIWTVPNQPSENVRFRVVVRDGSASTPDGEAISEYSVTIGDPAAGTPCSVTFTGSGDLGWRLLSYPLSLADTSTASVLSSLSGKYSVARAYDPTNPADPWSTHDPVRGSGDLAAIDHTMGFWVLIEAPGSLRVVGQTLTAPAQISLRAGWNLVGFPSFRLGYTVADLKAATGATMVEGLDPTAGPYYLQSLPDSYELRAFEGYWVYTPAPVTWTVPL